ncbi:MAG: NUDIX pyrophosphatase [Chloroflexi bacterium]|nr:NUDIX pyrophosphatase [Chloroflexota bacterium]
MARAAFNTAVFLYRKADAGMFEYALLKRADNGAWQGVCGGGEDDETPLEAAKRETFEETGQSPESPFLQLDTIEPIPVTVFGYKWDDDVYIISQYWFGVLANSNTIELSHEHTEYKWASYEDAHNLLAYTGNKTALWELNQRLKGNGPRG